MRGRSRHESSSGVGRHPPRGEHSQSLAAYGRRVSNRRKMTELGSERLPAGSVGLRSPDFADQLRWSTGTSGSCTHSRR